MRPITSVRKKSRENVWAVRTQESVRQSGPAKAVIVKNSKEYDFLKKKTDLHGLFLCFFWTNFSFSVTIEAEEI